MYGAGARSTATAFSARPGLARDNAGLFTNQEDIIPLYNIAQRRHPDRSTFRAANTLSTNEEIAHISSLDFSLPSSPQSGEEIDIFATANNYEPIAAPFLPNFLGNSFSWSQDDCNVLAPEAQSGSWSSPLGSSSNGVNISQQSGRFHSPSNSDDPGFVFGSVSTTYTPGPSTGSSSGVGELFQGHAILDVENPIFDLILPSKDS